MELLEATQTGDASAWMRAWQIIDGRDARALLQTLNESPAEVRLSLCGPSHARTFGPRRRGVLSRWRATLRPRPMADWLESL